MNIRNRNNRCGSALVATIVLAIVLAGLCAALLAATLSNEKGQVEAGTRQHAFYAAEAGLSDAFMRVSAGSLAPLDGQVLELGDAAAPVALGTSGYWVEISKAEEDPRGFLLVSTGIDGSVEARLKQIVSKKPTGFFQFAAFGSQGVLLNSNAFVDSYDSAYGPYQSQVQGGNAFARENGDVGSNGDIRLRANTTIHGDCNPGPGHHVDDSAPNIFVSGNRDPLLQPIAMPEIDVPVIASSGSIAGNSNVSAGPGDVHYTSVVMNGGTTLTIHGPARFVVDDIRMRSNSNLVFDTSGGPIQLYSSGDFNLESNSSVTTNSNSALGVQLFLSGDNMSPGHSDTIQLGSNSSFIGAIYAPHASFTLASNFDIYGSIMAGYLDLSSFGKIHFDEALLYDGYGATGELESRLWRPLPNP
jgi:hypothetical protein